MFFFHRGALASSNSQMRLQTGESSMLTDADRANLIFFTTSRFDEGMAATYGVTRPEAPMSDSGQQLPPGSELCKLHPASCRWRCTTSSFTGGTSFNPPLSRALECVMCRREAVEQHGILTCCAVAEAPRASTPEVGCLRQKIFASHASTTGKSYFYDRKSLHHMLLRQKIYSCR